MVEDADISKSTNRFTTGIGITYDAAGNVTQDTKFRSLQFRYDANNRQQWSANTDESNAVTAIYDGAGQRVGTKSNGSLSVNVYDAMGTLVAEYGQTASGAGTQYIFSDTQGSPRVVMKASDNSVVRHDYEAFGEEEYAGIGLRTAGQGYGVSDGVRQKYAGMEADESGLSHTLWRQYDSKSGRWTAPDPYNGSMDINSPQSFNRYNYVNNDPVNKVDPTGLMMAWPGGSGGGCVPGEPGDAYYRLMMWSVLERAVNSDYFYTQGKKTQNVGKKGNKGKAGTKAKPSPTAQQQPVGGVGSTIPPCPVVLPSDRTRYKMTELIAHENSFFTGGVVGAREYEYSTQARTGETITDQTATDEVEGFASSVVNAYNAAKAANQKHTSSIEEWLTGSTFYLNARQVTEAERNLRIMSMREGDGCDQLNRIVTAVDKVLTTGPTSNFMQWHSARSGNPPKVQEYPGTTRIADTDFADHIMWK